MRYIDTNTQIIPKHCIYGPRPVEGIVLNDFEWWRITNHLIREQKDKNIVAFQKAKEEAKKDVSFQMTKNWDNTLASVKTLSEQKRIEKREKEKQDKFDKYNEILKSKQDEKKKILEEVNKVYNENQDYAKTIKSGILYSLVLHERQKQIEMKNAIMREEEKKEKELAERYKKEGEEFAKEKLREKVDEMNKKKIQKEILDKQMADILLKTKLEREELIEEKQDLINMKIEAEKINHCDKMDKFYRRKFASKNIKKSQNRIEYDRKLILEEEEEDEINKIYIAYSKKFQKERKEKELQKMKDKIDQRAKISEKIAKKIAKTAQKKLDLQEAMEKAKFVLRERENKDSLCQKALAEIFEQKKISEEKVMKERREAQEAVKWEVIQALRSSELNEQWSETMQKNKKELQMKTRADYDEQYREKVERKANDLKEWSTSLENVLRNKEKEEIKYCDAAMDFVKQHNIPPYPVLAAIETVKKSNRLLKEQNEKKARYEVFEEETSDKKKKQKLLGSGCYCFKY